jgi:formyl-CoA transferase
MPAKKRPVSKTHVPLGNVRVLELAQYISGPYVGQMLGDLGAEVIKIERPGTGDPFRGWTGNTYSPHFAAFNRNKFSVALDLKTSPGQEAFRELIKDADVVICNLLSSTITSFGVEYERLARLNPRLVYCLISGLKDEQGDKPTYDTVALSVGGLHGLMTSGAAPKPLGIALADMITSWWAVQGILAALVERYASGKGQMVEISMGDAIIGSLGDMGALYLQTRRPIDCDTRPAMAQAYCVKTADDKNLTVHTSSSEKYWKALVEAVDRPDLLVDGRFNPVAARISHYEDLYSELASIFRQHPLSYWLSRLKKADVPHAPINTMADLFNDGGPGVTQIVRQSRGDGNTVLSIGSPIRLSRTPVTYRLPPPLLGEHGLPGQRQLARKAK